MAPSDLWTRVAGRGHDGWEEVVAFPMKICRRWGRRQILSPPQRHQVPFDALSLPRSDRDRCDPRHMVHVIHVIHVIRTVFQSPLAVETHKFMHPKPDTLCSQSALEISVKSHSQESRKPRKSRKSMQKSLRAKVSRFRFFARCPVCPVCPVSRIKSFLSQWFQGSVIRCPTLTINLRNLKSPSCKTVQMCCNTIDGNQRHSWQRPVKQRLKLLKSGT